MGNLSKGFSLLFLAILALSSIVIIKSANGEPVPTVPNFNVQYKTNPNGTQTIVLTINNQPFTTNLKNETDPTGVFAVGAYVALAFNVTTRIHNTENWTAAFDLSRVTIYPLQEGNQDTVLTYISNGDGIFHICGYYDYDNWSISDIYAPPNSQIDFRVQAMVGMVRMGLPVFWGLPFQSNITSDWSPIQTITIATSAISVDSLGPVYTFTIIGVVVVTVALVGFELIRFKRRRKNNLTELNP